MYLYILTFALIVLPHYTSAYVQNLERQNEPTVCNLHAELCDKSLGNITFAGAHDSFAWSTDPVIILSADQEVNVTSQLNLGVRFFENQAHWDDITQTLRFCHTSCLLYDGGTVQDYLSEVNTWLDSNPNDFLILLMTNDDQVSLITYWSAAFENSGILPKVFIPSFQMPIARSEWPTLGEIMATGKQVLVFMDVCADGSCGAAVGTLPYIFPEFQSISEDAFGDTDETFSCAPNRTTGPLATVDHMVLANHVNNLAFLGIETSDFEQASETNSVDSILEHANNCTFYSNGLWPNVILADFVDIGQLIQAVDILNGVSSA